MMKMAKKVRRLWVLKEKVKIKNYLTIPYSPNSLLDSPQWGFL
jgi:hypothetical protein